VSRAGKEAAPHVVVATLLRPQGGSGLQSHTRYLAEGLRQAGARCSIQTAFTGSRLWYVLFAVRPLLLRRLNRNWSTWWFRYWHTAALRRNLSRYLERHDVDLVIAQCPPAAAAALDLRARLGRSYKVVMVVHFNVSQAWEFEHRGELTSRRLARRMDELERRVVAAADGVIYVSDWARRLVEQDRGLTARRSTVVWNGLPPTDGGDPLDRRELGLGAGDLVIANVGVLEPRKNQLGLIELFERIAARYADTRLLLVGGGPQEATVRARVEERGLSGRVLVLGAATNVDALLRLSDLYVHYADMESLPLAILEAARARLPWAARAVGGIEELARVLGGGILLDPDDPDASLVALRPLLEDRGLRLRLGSEAHETFERHFTHAAMARAYLRFARDL
jgi:glycosyltransferase involved in cell wall biosynthesis